MQHTLTRIGSALERAWTGFGLGFATGAFADDPRGFATSSQTGAQWRLRSAVDCVVAADPPALRAGGSGSSRCNAGQERRGDAVAAVFVRRLIFTFAYPRALAGWLTLWMRKREGP